MSDSEIWTAERFADEKFDLTDAGRWTEIVAGKLVSLSPPDDTHGNVVRNLSAAIARMVHETQRGYACFELGLIVERNPDTVRSPAVCFFMEGEMFAEQDKLVTDTVPSSIIEIASTNDRRKGLSDRVTSYLDWGVPFVGVVDSVSRICHSFQLELPPIEASGDQNAFQGSAIIGDMKVTVNDLFREPKWWR